VLDNSLVKTTTPLQGGCSASASQVGLGTRPVACAVEEASFCRRARTVPVVSGKVSGESSNDSINFGITRGGRDTESVNLVEELNVLGGGLTDTSSEVLGRLADGDIRVVRVSSGKHDVDEPLSAGCLFSLDSCTHGGVGGGEDGIASLGVSITVANEDGRESVVGSRAFGSGIDPD